MYGIYARYYYYPNVYRAKKDGALMKNEYDRLKFATREDAAAWLELSAEDKVTHDINRCEPYKDKNGKIRYAQADTYYSAHGEYSRPDYMIVKLRK